MRCNLRSLERSIQCPVALQHCMNNSHINIHDTSHLECPNIKDLYGYDQPSKGWFRNVEFRVIPHKMNVKLNIEWD